MNIVENKFMSKVDREKKEYYMFLQYTDYNYVENLQETPAILTSHNKLEAIEKFLNESSKMVEETQKQQQDPVSLHYKYEPKVVEGQAPQ